MVPEIKCVGYIRLKDGRTVPLESLTPEERKRCMKSMAERTCRVMSEYYAQHSDEYEKLKSL